MLTIIHDFTKTINLNKSYRIYGVGLPHQLHKVRSIMSCFKMKSYKHTWLTKNLIFVQTEYFNRSTELPTNKVFIA